MRVSFDAGSKVYRQKHRIQMQAAIPATAPPMIAPKFASDSDFASSITGTGGTDTGVVVT